MYYRGSSNYPHPTQPGRVLCYIRNMLGWRVSVTPAGAKLLAPFDLYQDKAGQVWCKSVLGKQILIGSLLDDYELFRHVTVIS